MRQLRVFSVTLSGLKNTELARRFVYGKEWIWNNKFMFLPYYIYKLMLFDKKQLIPLSISMDLL